MVYDALAAAKARGVDVVIIDTAGRLHTKFNLMEELKKIRRVMDKHGVDAVATVLVLDATTGQNGLAQARQFRDTVGLDGLIITKLDGTARGGIIFAIVNELRIPVRENVPLARGLYKYGRVDQPIPGIFYQAVAIVLAALFKQGFVTNDPNPFMTKAELNEIMNQDND